jgi:hypothetical protein
LQRHPEEAAARLADRDRDEQVGREEAVRKLRGVLVLGERGDLDGVDVDELLDGGVRARREAPTPRIDELRDVLGARDVR